MIHLRRRFSHLFMCGVVWLVSLVWAGNSTCVRVVQASDTPSDGDTVESRIDIGFDGYFKVGCWTPIRIEWTSGSADSFALAELEMTVSAPDPSGNLVTYPVPLAETDSPQKVVGISVFKSGKLDGELTVKLSHEGTVRFSRTVNCASPPEDIPAKPLRQSDPLVVTSGNPVGFDQLSQLWLDPSVNTDTKPAVAPYEDWLREFDESRFLEGVNVLVVNGDPTASSIGGAAIKDWVADGGHLFFAFGDIQPATPNDVLSDRFGIRLEGTQQLIPRDASSLEAFSESKEGIPFATSLVAVKMSTPDGMTLIEGLDFPLLSRFAYGTGRISCLAIALDRNGALSRWKGLEQFCTRALIEVEQQNATARKTERRRLSRTGINELATQLLAFQDDFPSIHRFSSWQVMGFMVVYLILIGPIDYLLVHRILKRPYLTWFTFPLFVFVIGFAAMQAAAAANGNQLRINQFEIVDLDQTTGHISCRSWFTIYSPKTSKYELDVRGELPQFNGDRSSQQPPPKETPAMLSWQGRPEDGPGGIYRTGGVQFASAAYDAEMENVPVVIWSTKPLRAEWDSQAENLVESNLTSTGLGQLSGTIRHHLPVSINNWIVAYQNRVYRPRTEDNVEFAEWRPHELWEPRSPRVHRRELHGYLTRTKFYKAARTEGYGDDILVHEEPYNPLDRNPSDFARVLTFHEASGGTPYTTLQNSALKEMDLSWALDHNRAVLFGQVDETFTKMDVDGRPREADRHSAFVRILMPVKHVEGAERILPDLEMKVGTPNQLRKESRRNKEQ